MNITSSILLLLLACSVASLSMRSHNPVVNIEAPNSPSGQTLGELVYNTVNGQQVRTKIINGRGNTNIQDPAEYSQVRFYADPSIKAVNSVSSIPWLRNYNSIMIAVSPVNGGNTAIVFRGM